MGQVKEPILIRGEIEAELVHLRRIYLKATDRPDGLIQRIEDLEDQLKGMKE